MTAEVARARSTGPGAPSASALAWIDAHEAVVVRWQDGDTSLDRLASDVPDHHRATGAVRRVPTVGGAGGGHPQTADEPRRLEHLARWVDRVVARLPADVALLILGPGTVREHLEREVREADARHGRARLVSSEASPRLTDRQLVARLRSFAGAEPPRQLPTRGRTAATPGRNAATPGRNAATRGR